MKQEPNKLLGDDSTVGPSGPSTAQSLAPNPEQSKLTAYEHFLSLIARDDPALYRKVTGWD